MSSLATHLEGSFSINPATGQEVAHYAYNSQAEVDRILAAASSGFNVWSSLEPRDRATVFQSMAAIVRSKLEVFARMATLEMGKPISQARAEVEKCAVLCDWAAAHCVQLVADEATAVGSGARVAYRPMGTVLAIMPWNFPFWQAMRAAAGVLIGGNSFLLKPAPNVLGCARLLANAWNDAGLPHGAFGLLHVANDTVSSVIADHRMTGVMVTGSVRAGSHIASQAGACLKKTVLELGGSDPFIVLEDADVGLAVEAAVLGRFQNTGQVCIAAKRIIVHTSLLGEFTERFVQKVSSLKVGDPMRDDVFIGPMARLDLRDELHTQVMRTIDEGAHLLLGGKKIDGPDNFYEPTVLTGVRHGMTAFREEVFGPVASLIEAADEDEALALANDSQYGLCSSLWTQDRAAADRFARKLHTGGVFINKIPISDPRVPIGGIKSSGYGRELSSFGVREFQNIQTVWSNLP